MKRFLWLVLLLTLLTTVTTATNVDGLKIIENGKSKCLIIISNNAANFEKNAATELQEHLYKIAGAKIELRTASQAQLSARVKEAVNKGLAPIILGTIGLTSELEKQIKAEGSDPGSFTLVVDELGITIAGLSPEGSLFGAYELLEQIGCRWFMPGEIGMVIPELKTVVIKKQQTIQVPSFSGRWHGPQVTSGWSKRVRMGGEYFPSAHGIPPIRQTYFKDHPEYFALVDGKRNPKQVCISNPDVLRLTITGVRNYFRNNPSVPWYGIGPGDGSSFCECENCQALDADDFDYLTNEMSMTDRYIWFFNQILEGIADEFPDKKLAFYVYHAYQRPPVKYKPNPNIVPAFAPIRLCRAHGMGNEICPEKSYYAILIKQWTQLLPLAYERGYWFNLADPGFPFSMVHRMRFEIPYAKEVGLAGWRVETINNWGSETPSLYIAAKLMWDHTADVDELLADFYDKFFGPASEPMGNYFELMDAAIRDSDHHTGCSFDMPYFYPPKLRAKAREFLAAAAVLAGEGIYGTRVKLFSETFAYLEAFISMTVNNNKYDFVAAKEDLNQIEALQEKLLSYNPPMVHNKLAKTYFQLFFKKITEEGYARTKGRNKLLASFPVTGWDFLLDPIKIGNDLGYWRKDLVGGNWQKTNTASSWSNQGLRYYYGDAWYRQKVQVPQLETGSKVFLWFGSIDETAKVWVNGKEVGEIVGSAFVPIEFDVTAAIIANEENTIAIKLTNEIVNEIGTGGIIGPVMLYSQER